MSKNNNSPKAAQLRADLQQFRGDVERYRHSLNLNFIYTPGVRYLAE